MRLRRLAFAAATGLLQVGLTSCPAEELPRRQPDWSYPSTRRDSAVPVPSFRSPPSGQRDSEPPNSTAAIPRQASRPSGSQRRDPVTLAPASVFAQEDIPPAPVPFHNAPFADGDPAGPPASTTPGPYAPLSPFDGPVAGTAPGWDSYSWNNVYLFALVDGFKQTGGDDRLAGRIGINWGLPIIDDRSGFGFQIGGSGSVADGGEQFFVTGGLFYQSALGGGVGWSVGGVIDWMADEKFQAHVTQVRAKASITLDRQNEIGVWGATSIDDDETDDGEEVDSVDQANFFYRHLWPNGADTTGWVGWRSDPSSPAIGADVRLPLGEHWAVSLGGHYAFEGDNWNAYAGLVLDLGARARQRCLGQYRHLPYLPVADNTSMTLAVED